MVDSYLMEQLYAVRFNASSESCMSELSAETEFVRITTETWVEIGGIVFLDALTSLCFIYFYLNATCSGGWCQRAEDRFLHRWSWG